LLRAGLIRNREHPGAKNSENDERIASSANNWVDSHWAISGSAAALRQKR
jgi:hypothetical protein